jgi:hypothetical protein
MIKVDVSSIAGAIGKAMRGFVKSLDHKQRLDANEGLHWYYQTSHHFRRFR